jgi:hypothetical protein
MDAALSSPEEWKAFLPRDEDICRQLFKLRVDALGYLLLAL